MPGILGLVSRTVSSSLPARELQSVVGAMPLDPNWKRYDWATQAPLFATVCFGRSDDVESKLAQDSSYTLILDGEIYGVGGNQASYLLRQFTTSGLKGLSEVEGRFIAAVWDDQSQKLTLIADKFASRPLYYSTTDGRFAFGSSINALRSLATGAATTNLQGLIQFFTFGHLWNDDTFYEGIKAVFPAEVMTFDANTNSLTKDRYWSPGNLPWQPDSKKSLEALSQLLRNSVLSQSNEVEGLGVALSGGLDARTILGLVDLEKVHPACVSLGMEGSLDQKSARRLAELAGCAFHSLVLGDGFLEKFREHITRMVRLTDGHYLSQCIVMPTFPLYQSLGIRTLLRGHAGELLHMHKAYNFSVDSSFAEVKTSEQLEAWLSPRLQAYLTEGVQEPLFCGVSRREFEESGKLSLRNGLARTKYLERPLDRLSLLFLEQRTRRETAMSMTKFNSVVEPRLPFLNSNFVDAVFATEPSLRVGESIQTYMLHKYRPAFLGPANSNTGASVGASPLVQKLCYYRMRILAKLGVKGYQPYERTGLWLKRELRPFVEEILLDSQCLDRGLLNPDCIRGVVSRHMDSKANHTYLIMAFLIVELGLRNGMCRSSDLS